MSRNQHRNSKKINIAEIKQSFCNVCFLSFQKKQAKKINQGLDILVCSKCHCMAHQSCYGFQTNTTLLAQGVRQFLCEKCNQQAAFQSCIVCFGKNGAMKELQNSKGKFIHVFCALTHNYVDTAQCYPQLTFRLNENFQVKKYYDKCQICGLEGANQKCAQQLCNKRVHAYCAQTEYKNGQQSDNLQCWKYFIQPGDNKAFDVQKEKLKRDWIQNQVNKSLNRFNQYNQIPQPDKENILKELYQQYQKEYEKEKENQVQVRRGGFCYSFCSQHGAQIYCICFNKGQGSGDMVQCQSCFQWYHQTCVKFVPKSQNDTFICRQCYEFYDMKKKIVDEIKNNKPENFEIKTDLHHKLSLFDYVWLLRAVDLRIAVGGASPKTLKLVSLLPIKSSKIEMLVKSKNRNRLSAYTDHFLKEFLRKQIQLLKPLKVMELDSQGRPVTLEQNAMKNKKLREYVNFASGFVKNNRLPDIYQSLIQELQFKQNALSDQYEKIVNLSKSKQYYPEIEVLRIKAQAYSFMEIIKKVNTGSIIQFQDLQQALIKAKSASNVPEYLILPLVERFQKATILVNEMKNQIYNNPQNLQNLDKRVKDLQQLKICPPHIYKQFKSQLKFLNDLYLFYLKQTGGQLNLKKSVNAKVEQLNVEKQIKGSRQLSQIINSFNNNNSQMIIKGLSELIQKYSQISVQTQVKNALSTKTISYQKLQKLLKKTKNQLLQSHSQQVKNFIQQWIKVKEVSFQVLHQDLTEVDNISAIQQYQQKLRDVFSMIADLPVVIQSAVNKESGNPLAQKLMRRKDELNQLMILCTQSKLDKNPLTISKLYKDLPKNNKLVINYLSLKKQSQGVLQKYHKMMKRISEKISCLKNFMKKSKKDLIKENSQKPQIVDLTDLIEELTNQQVSFIQQTSKLQKMINNSIQIASQVKKYISKLPDQTFQKCKNIDELIKYRKEIDELKKKIFLNAEISLKEQLASLYQLQVSNKIKALLLSHTSDLQKIGKVLKLAQQQDLTHLTSYLQLKNNFKTKSQTRQQVALVQSFQHQLISKAEKDKDFLFAGLQSLRKSLNLPDISLEKQKDKNNKDELIQNLMDKNKFLRKKIDMILTKNPSKYDFNEARQVFLQSLKNPYNQPKLSKLSDQLHKFNRLLLKWKEGSKPSSSKTLFFQSYDESIFTYQQIEQVRTSLKSTQDALEQLQILCKNATIQNSVKIQDIMQHLQTQNSLKQLKGYEKARIKYIDYWMDQVKTAQKTKEQQIPFQKIKRLLFQSYMVLQNKLKNRQDYSMLQQTIQYLQSLFEKIKQRFKNKGQDQQIRLVQGFIDVQTLAYQINIPEDIDDLIKIQYPFKDLDNFKYLPLIKISSQKDLMDQPVLNFKRSKPFDNNLLQDMGLRDQPIKLIKINQDSEKESQQRSHNQSQDKSQQQIPLTVTQSQRKRIKEILLKNMKKNTELNVANLSDLQEYVKMIENQIFGSYHNNVLKYLETSNQYQKLFIKLLKCPKISLKLAKKKFDFKFIDLLVGQIDKIQNYQIMMVKKNKQEQEKQKQKKQKQKRQKQKQNKSKFFDEQNDNKNTIQNSNNILDMLATGKVDEAQQRQLKNEMRAIKQSSRHRDKDRHRKKKHRHSKRSRSRSRSKSPKNQAKFSSDSQQQQQLPAYIQKQYNKQMNMGYQDLQSPLPQMPIWDQNPGQMYMMGQINQAPMMFDPDAQIENQQVAYYPKGTVLKIKQSTLQFSTKKKGKVQFKGMMLSDQEHRKIVLQLVDPDFTKISIKRDKNQDEIIQYLNKPSKKKYKFLIGWFEAIDQRNNQYLKQLSIENAQKKKIFGVQNDHIKMHIMSIRQLMKINRFYSPPCKVTTQAAAKQLKDDRMIYIIQYPGQKMYELKGIFQNFRNIQGIENTVEVGLPIQLPPMIPPPLNIPNLPLLEFNSQNDMQTDNTYDLIMSGGFVTNVYNNKILDQRNIRNISQQQQAIAHNSNNDEYEGWGTSNDTNIEPVQPQISLYRKNETKSYRKIVGGYNFSPILTQQQDNNDGNANTTSGNNKIQQQKDFASNILSYINQMGFKDDEPNNNGNNKGGSQSQYLNQNNNNNYQQQQRYNQNNPNQQHIRWNSNNNSNQYNNRGGNYHQPHHQQQPMGYQGQNNPMMRYNQNNNNNNPMYRNPMNSNTYHHQQQHHQPVIKDNRMNYQNKKQFYNNNNNNMNPMQFRQNQSNPNQPQRQHIYYQNYNQQQQQGNSNTQQQQQQPQQHLQQHYQQNNNQYDRNREY